MLEPKELYGWDFPDTDMVPDGYGMKQIPALSRDNFNLLVTEHNKLVELIEVLCNSTGISMSGQ